MVNPRRLPLRLSLQTLAPGPSSATKPVPIPLAEVATDAEAASARLRDMLDELSPEPITEEVAQQLPVRTREIDARLRESRKIVARDHPSRSSSVLKQNGAGCGAICPGGHGI